MYSPNKLSYEIGLFECDKDVIAKSWKYFIKHKNLPDAIAIMILAVIVYWYRPIITKDKNGKDVLNNKYKDDFLQMSYQQLIEETGFSKSQIRLRLERLEDLGIIKRHFRTVEYTDKNNKKKNLYNVLYIELFADKLNEISHSTSKAISQPVSKNKNIRQSTNKPIYQQPIRTPARNNNIKNIVDSKAVSNKYLFRNRPLLSDSIKASFIKMQNEGHHPQIIKDSIPQKVQDHAPQMMGGIAPQMKRGHHPQMMTYTKITNPKITTTKNNKVVALQSENCTPQITKSSAPQMGGGIAPQMMRGHHPQMMTYTKNTNPKNTTTKNIIPNKYTNILNEDHSSSFFSNRKLEELEDLSLTKDQKETFYRLFDDETIKKGIMYLNSRSNAPNDVGKYLYTACKNKWEPPKTKEDVKCKNFQHAIQYDGLKAKSGWDSPTINVSRNYFEISIPGYSLQPVIIDTNDDDFIEKINIQMKKYGFLMR